MNLFEKNEKITKPHTLLCLISKRDGELKYESTG